MTKHVYRTCGIVKALSEKPPLPSVTDDYKRETSYMKA
jgi:hypothetical protein